MRPISLDTRRAILQAKLSGASTREVADEFDVSVGTVSNVVAEAREGAFDEVANLEDHVDALLDLGRRLREADLDLAAAQLGLDVHAWIADLGLDPADVERFKTEIERIAGEEADIATYGTAVRELLTLEETTGLAIEDRLGELVTSLAERDPEEVRRLDVVTQQAETLPVDVEQLEAAISQAVELHELGFDLDTAERLAAELDAADGAGQNGAIETLANVYAEYDDLTEAVAELRSTKQSLESECETLRAKRADLEDERDQLQETITRLQPSLDTLQNTLEELRATEADLRDDIAQQRDRLDAIESKLNENKGELEAVQKEREVVHAYRRFLSDAELSDTVLSDIGTLVEIDSDEDTTHLDPYASDIRERTVSELRDVAYEMLEGEAMMPVAEHERKLREKGETERTLEELEQERQAVQAYIGFLDTGEISERLLEELRDLKRGRSRLPDFSEERKSQEVREFLIDQLNNLTEDEPVITEKRHRELLLEERSHHREQLDSVTDAIERLTALIDRLQLVFDEDWTADVAQRVIEALDDGDDRVTVGTIQEAFRDVITDEFDRRLDFDLEDGIANGAVLEGGVGPGTIFDPDSHPSDGDEE